MTDLGEEVRKRTGQLSVLLHAARDEGVDLTAVIDATQELVERQLGSDALEVLILGDTSAERGAVLDLVVGTKVFAHLPDGAKVVTTLRVGSSYAYTTRTRDGKVDTFVSPVRDIRGRLKDLAEEAEAELSTRQASLFALEAEIVDVKRARVPAVPVPKREKREEPENVAPVNEKDSLPPLRPAEAKPSSAFAVAWLWLVAFFARLFGRPAPALPAAPPASTPASAPASPPVMAPAPETDDEIVTRTITPYEDGVVGLEKKAEEARARLNETIAHCEEARTTASRHVIELRDAFATSLRALFQDRGLGDLVELTVDVPSKVLPASVALLDAPGLASDSVWDRNRARAVLRDVDGCILASGGVAKNDSRLDAIRHDLGPVAPQVLPLRPSAADLVAAVARIRAQRPLVIGARAIAFVRGGMAGAERQAEQGQERSRERIATLETHRLADPTAFREGVLAHFAPAITEGAAGILRAALDRLRARMEAILNEWKESVQACSGRDAVETCVAAINTSAQTRITAVVEEISDLVLEQMQRVSDALQTSMREELMRRLKLVKTGFGDDGAMVVSDVTAQDFADLRALPLEGAMDAFEHQRVSIGIGGAAAGAVIGTLIVPGIGTAIGAFVGVLAGFLKTTDSLKNDCLAKLDACLTDAETQLRTQLEGRQASLVTGIRGSLEEALDSSLQRFDRSVTRMIDNERKTLAAETRKVDRIAEIRKAIDTDETRFAELAKMLPAVSST